MILKNVFDCFLQSTPVSLLTRGQVLLIIQQLLSAVVGIIEIKYAAGTTGRPDLDVTKCGCGLCIGFLEKKLAVDVVSYGVSG